MNAIYVDEQLDAIYLDDGRVVSKSAYVGSNTIAALAYLEKTNDPNLYNIIGTDTRSVIGVFNMMTRTPQYIVQQAQTQTIYSNGYGQQSNNGGVGGVTSGAVTIDGSGNVTTSTQQVQVTTASIEAAKPTIIENKVQEVESVIYADEFALTPIPTSYSKLKTFKSGVLYGWMTEIAGDNEVDIKRHNDVYNKLASTSKEKNNKIEISEPVYIDGINSVASLKLKLQLEHKSGVNILLAGSRQFGDYSKVNTRISSIKDVHNENIQKDEDANLALSNSLLSIASQSTNLTEWISLAKDKLTIREQKAVAVYVTELISDYLTVINNRITVGKTWNVFNYRDSHITDMVSSADDLILRQKYLDGVDTIYKKLCMLNPIKAFRLNSVLSYRDESSEAALVYVAGICETLPTVVTHDVEIDDELAVLASKINDKSVYLINEITPNTLGLVKDIFNNNVISTEDKIFDYTDYSNCGNDRLILINNNVEFKVIKRDGKYYIRILG